MARGQKVRLDEKIKRKINRQENAVHKEIQISNIAHGKDLK